MICFTSRPLYPPWVNRSLILPIGGWVGPRDYSDIGSGDYEDRYLYVCLESNQDSLAPSLLNMHIIIYRLQTGRHPGRFWGSPCHRYNGYSALFPRGGGSNGTGVKLTAYLGCNSEVKIGGAIPPFPHMSSWPVLNKLSTGTLPFFVIIQCVCLVCIMILHRLELIDC
jgi:hypothetical protein